VCDLDAERAKGLAEAFEVPNATASFDALCRMDGLDAIDICTPSYLHAAQAHQALGAGVHVVCEKPVAGSLAALDALAAAEIRCGRRVMPVFNYRFGAGVQKLRRLIETGVAGQPYLATIEVAWRRRADYYDASHGPASHGPASQGPAWHGRWETELGGNLTTHAVHFLDLLLYLLGPARSVFARTATLVNPIETEDCATVSLEMANGALASVSATTGSSVQISRQRYCFANLVAESNLAPYDANSSEPWQFVADTPELKPRMDSVLASTPAAAEGFVGHLARFGEALRQGAELPVTLADARVTIELLTAIYASARSGATVALPIGPEHPMYAGWQPRE
jgi:predicted dehydrogenase